MRRGCVGISSEAVEKWIRSQRSAEKLNAANERLTRTGEAPEKLNDFPHIMTAMLAEQADISQINSTFGHGQRVLTEETQAAAIKEAEKRIKKIQSLPTAKLADESLTDLIAKGDPIIVSFSQMPRCFRNSRTD